LRRRGRDVAHERAVGEHHEEVGQQGEQRRVVEEPDDRDVAEDVERRDDENGGHGGRDLQPERDARIAEERKDARDGAPGRRQDL